MAKEESLRSVARSLRRCTMLIFFPLGTWRAGSPPKARSLSSGINRHRVPEADKNLDGIRGSEYTPLISRNSFRCLCLSAPFFIPLHRREFAIWIIYCFFVYSRPFQLFMGPITFDNPILPRTGWLFAIRHHLRFLLSSSMFSKSRSTNTYASCLCLCRGCQQGGVLMIRCNMFFPY